MQWVRCQLHWCIHQTVDHLGAHSNSNPNFDGTATCSKGQLIPFASYLLLKFKIEIGTAHCIKDRKLKQFSGRDDTMGYSANRNFQLQK